MRQQLPVAAEQVDYAAWAEGDRGVVLPEVFEIELGHRHAQELTLRPAGPAAERDGPAIVAGPTERLGNIQPGSGIEAMSGDVGLVGERSRLHRKVRGTCAQPAIGSDYEQVLDRRDRMGALAQTLVQFQGGSRGRANQRVGGCIAHDDIHRVQQAGNLLGECASQTGDLLLRRLDDHLTPVRHVIRGESHHRRDQHGPAQPKPTLDAHGGEMRPGPALAPARRGNRCNINRTGHSEATV